MENIRAGILGRRVEVDGSWTAYHVFTGTPALIEGRVMTDLSQDCATSIVLAHNCRQHSAPAAPACAG